MLQFEPPSIRNTDSRVSLSAALDMTLIGKDGKPYRPQEWFAVPLDTAREVIRRIVDGTIIQYRMDNPRNQTYC